jgi:hypothetical protein
MNGRVFLVIILFVCFSCRNSSNKTTEFVFPEADSVPVSEAEKLSPEAIADISKNISSPVEIANLLQTLEIPFSQNYIAASIDANKQSTNWGSWVLIWDILTCMKKLVLRLMFCHQ